MLHELLSNENWLCPQIDYLVWLQNIRFHLGPIFDNFFLGITKLGELCIPTMAMCIIYWCINAEAGIYLFTLNSLGLLCAKFFKMATCIYRPWVLSQRVIPIETALKMSGGYSFPSGHTLMAGTTWGGMAYLLRKNRILCILIIFLILLIGFSRNYIGVHTPQDILFGLITSIILIFGVHHLLKWCEKDKNRYLYTLAIINILTIAAMFYIVCKSYPTDYVNGKLLVNPHHAIYISILYSGWILGIINGLFLSKRFFPFNPKIGSLKSKIIRGLVGIIFLFGLFILLNDYLFSNIINYKLAFTIMFCIGFFITGGYPYLILKIHNPQ